MNAAGFYEAWSSIPGDTIARALERARHAAAADVNAALERIPADSDGFLALISPAADGMMERIERAARELTIQRFGRTVNLYIPLYLSNQCVNDCAYCWFGSSRAIGRRTLTLVEAEAEGLRLREEGYRSVLLVAGEDPRHVTADYLADCARLMKRLGFAFVGIETQTFAVEDYARLASAGVDGVTVYQETYDPRRYRQLHPKGPKRDYAWRMDAANRAARAGIRSVGVGALLGLGDFYHDALALATHVKHLYRRHWQTSVSISFPRLHAAPEHYAGGQEVTDAMLTRLIMAMRLTFPDAMLTLSTREAAPLRDRLFGAGVNQVSAGSKTSPGAYTAQGAAAGEQFPVVDDRPPARVIESIRGHGLEWVFKDWDATLLPVGKEG